jgi:hypothetical protein
MGLEQNVDDVAVLIDGPPEVLTLATNRHKEFVEIATCRRLAGHDAEAAMRTRG